MRKPKVIRYFPSKIVKCLDCGHEDKESKFISEEQSHKALISALN